MGYSSTGALNIDTNDLYTLGWDTLHITVRTIFAHQGFCVYEALAHIDMITCISTARRPVYNKSFHCCTD